MVRSKAESQAVLVRIPKGMLDQIEKLVEKKLYRAPSDFFYVAGQKELDRVTDRLDKLEEV